MRVEERYIRVSLLGSTDIYIYIYIYIVYQNFVFTYILMHGQEIIYLVPNLLAGINFWRFGVGESGLSTTLPNCCIASFPRFLGMGLQYM